MREWNILVCFTVTGWGRQLRVGPAFRFYYSVSTFNNIGKLVAINPNAKKPLLSVDTFNSVVSNEPVLVKQLYVGESPAVLLGIHCMNLDCISFVKIDI